MIVGQQLAGSPAENALLSSAVPLRAEVVTGLAAVLARLPEVDALVAGTPQEAECVDLPYILCRPTRLRTRPALVLLYEQESAGAPVRRLRGAVVLYEFGSLLRGQKLFSCYSRRGFRTVLGPVEQRVALAARTAQAMLDYGALFLNLEINMGPMDPVAYPAETDPMETAGAQEAVRALAFAHWKSVIRQHLRGIPGVRTEWALHDGVKHFDMALYPEPERTWACVSRKTWKNFRRNQRLCMRELEARYEPDVSVNHGTFLELSRNSSFPVSRALMEWRFRSLTSFPNVFLAGLRDGNGVWLSLVGARRNKGAVTIDWQLNRTGFERYSLGSSTRSFLIDHEAAAGSTSLSLEGGTNSHSIYHSFRRHTVYNLAVRRNSAVLRLLIRFLTRFFPRKFVTLALLKPWRRWVPL